ncbi:hypothetical protein T4B_15195 [Trichinella pseudospiralis]|uniref:Uncharacterized protein n=1 Tax=Trichinella pseudospiralis TaxID=6337 RepID=A0A0V1H487_TRIPS|nr:hypothetical protein T4B_15195 [Trichinella pseudospiralis]
MDHNRTHSSALEHHRESRPATRCNQCVCHLAPPVITKTIKQQNHAGEGNMRRLLLRSSSHRLHRVRDIAAGRFVQSSNPSTCLSSNEGPESNGSPAARHTIDRFGRSSAEQLGLLLMISSSTIVVTVLGSPGMVRGSAGTSSSSGFSSNIRCLCVGATYCRTLACYTYIADLFAQGLDLSGRTRILHNVLVGVPAAMHSDGSFRHANVIAKIAPNSMQIFALSQLPGDIGVLSARIPYYICDTDIATERCGNRELEQNVEITPSGLTAVYGFSHPRGQTTAWAIGKVARTVTCSSVLCRTSRSGNSSVLSNGDTISRFVPEPPDDVDGVTSSGVDGSLVLAPRLETGGVRGLIGVDGRVAAIVLGDGRFEVQ